MCIREYTTDKVRNGMMVVTSVVHVMMSVKDSTVVHKGRIVHTVVSCTQRYTSTHSSKLYTKAG